MNTAVNLLGEAEKRNNRQLEAQYVQKPFAKHLRQTRESGYIFKLNPELVFFEFTSLANTFAGSAHKGKIMKDMGMRKGWFDLSFLWRFKGQRYEFGCIECKWDNNDYSDSQQELADSFVKNDVPHAKVYSKSEGCQVLRGWGIKV